MSIKTSVTPASGEACFVIVPCTYAPGQEAPFAIAVTSSRPVVFEPILERPSITALWVRGDALMNHDFLTRIHYPRAI